MELINWCLLKAENPEAYKKLAQTGVMVGFPVKIQGQHARPDNGIHYHSTVKFFNPEKDNVDEIHSIASKLRLTPPDPKQTKIEPGMFKDRMGNDVYVIKLHGAHANEIKDHNAKFSHMGYPATFEYTPHVSVDKATWDNIVASKATTAHEAGIEFLPAQLKQGPNVLHTYPHLHAIPGGSPKIAEEPKEKLAASEEMAKGFLKQMGTAAAMATAIAGATTAGNEAMPATFMQQQRVPYSSSKMLRTIANVESTGGKYTAHKPVESGGEVQQAYGRYALMPDTIKETIKINPELRKKHKKALALSGDDLHRYLQDNPGLEEQIASRHLARLEHHFGQDPAKIGYAWLQGITGTNKALKENKNINDHWHVRKINSAYAKGN